MQDEGRFDLEDCMGRIGVVVLTNRGVLEISGLEASGSEVFQVTRGS
jgi:hypothetical protein